MDIKRRYAVEVMNIYQALAVENNNEDETGVEWNTWKGSLTSAAENIVPVVRKKSKQKWMTDEILDKMAQSRKNKWNHEKYAELDREVRRLCDQAKEEWLNKECDELERQQQYDMKVLHRKEKEISGKNTGGTVGCIKSRDGEIIMEKEKNSRDLIWTE